MSEFSLKLDTAKLQIEQWLKQDCLQSAGSLSEAARYSVLCGGKRFRAVLAMLTGEMLSIDLNKLRPLAVALELVHAASLVHDDLPALDNDDLRRGKPTCHRVYGEDIAIVAGDALFLDAFRVLSVNSALADIEKAKLIALLSGASIEMCEGQALDLRAEHGEEGLEVNSEVELRERHLRKTGALIRAALCGPALLNGAHSEQELLTALGTYGNSLGLLFQITDDILDVTSDTEKLGKNAASDIEQDTPTYVSVFGVDKAKELAKETAAEARRALDSLSYDTAVLGEICDMVLCREM